MSEVKDQGHIEYPVSNRCTSFSFHINQTNHFRDMAQRVFDLKKTRPFSYLQKKAQLECLHFVSPVNNFPDIVQVIPLRPFPGSQL